MKKVEYNRDYLWTLKEGYPPLDKGKVFSCFAGGGGSSMGYKRAGFEVVGCLEIDPRQMEVYTTNHHPKYAYTEAIQDFKYLTDLPSELYHLDILDGSPPCSTFSLAGDREKSWGKHKHFREGQAAQVLDTLFFDFIDLARELKPKVVIAENVAGILQGSAIKYVQRIYKELEEAGYCTTHKLLNGADMGLPQRRERVFFTAIRRDLAGPFLDGSMFFVEEPILNLNFNYPHVPFKEIKGGEVEGRKIPKTTKTYKLWLHRKPSDIGIKDAHERLYGKQQGFANNYMKDDKVCPTIIAKEENGIVYDEGRFLYKEEIVKASSFPLDFDFCGQRPQYVCGMSVPPLMMQRVATEVYNQWLSKL